MGRDFKSSFALGFDPGFDSGLFLIACSCSFVGGLPSCFLGFFHQPRATVRRDALSGRRQKLLSAVVIAKVEHLSITLGT
jgi:hypothetical protein